MFIIYLYIRTFYMLIISTDNDKNARTVNKQDNKAGCMPLE